MKKKVTVLFAVITLFVTTTFANNITEPNTQIKTTFSELFDKATEVNWETISGFYMATFKQGDQYLTAYFNPAGTIEAVSRNIVMTSLPLILQKELQDKVQNGWIIETSELLGKNGTAYYVTIENANTKTVYEATQNSWSVYKTLNK
jgi:hypothetical protein